MRTPRVLAFVILLAVSAFQAAPTAQLPIFKGEFRLSNIDVVGDDVMLLVMVRVTNTSDDVALDARISFDRADDDSSGEAIATFERTTFGAGQTVRLEQRVHITFAEYQAWVEGHRPRFSVSFNQQSGESVHALLELTETTELTPGGGVR